MKRPIQGEPCLKGPGSSSGAGGGRQGLQMVLHLPGGGAGVDLAWHHQPVACPFWKPDSAVA